ncbi:MAG: RNA polymerase sigma-70 factor [Bacteroidales bacterium]
MNLKDFKDFECKSDKELFRFLIARYFGPLCLYTMRFTHDKSSAEEIVHDTFVKLWERREKIEVKENVVAYLYKSVQNNALNYLKSEQTRRKYSEAYSDKLKQAQDYYAITQESGLSVLLAKELETKIIEAVDSLPVQCKEIFKLSRFSGLKNQEIADKKNITLNTVQKQISIALEKLHEMLDDHLPKVIQYLILIDIAKSIF